MLQRIVFLPHIPYCAVPFLPVKLLIDHINLDIFSIRFLMSLDLAFCVLSPFYPVQVLSPRRLTDTALTIHIVTVADEDKAAKSAGIIDCGVLVERHRGDLLTPPPPNYAVKRRCEHSPISDRNEIQYTNCSH